MSHDDCVDAGKLLNDLEKACYEEASVEVPFDEELSILRDHDPQLGCTRVTIRNGLIIEHRGCFYLENFSLEPPVISRDPPYPGQYDDCLLFSVCQRERISRQRTEKENSLGVPLPFNISQRGE